MHTIVHLLLLHFKKYGKTIDNATSYFEEILRSTENDEDDITIEQQQHDDKKESTDPIKSSSKKRKIDVIFNFNYSVHVVVIHSLCFCYSVCSGCR